MAAYAALVSLMQIFDQIEHHPSPPISLDDTQVESLTQIVAFLQEFLEGYKSPFADGDEADPLEMRIADAVYAAEDAIESHIVDQTLSAASDGKRDRIGIFNCFRGPKEPQNDGPKITSADLFESLQKAIQDLDMIKKEVMETVAVEAQLQSSGSMLGNNSSTSSLSRLNSTMVGFDDVMLQLMDKLNDRRLGRHVIPIVGMGGIGKTTLARNVYANPFIAHHFEICAWVTISQQYNTKELLCQILSQAKEGNEGLSKMRTDKENLSRVNREGKNWLSRMSEDEIGVAVHKCLSHRRFFIVLDDMWSVEAWEKLRRYFPDNGNASRIVVTTRLSSLGSQLDNSYALNMKFMNEESSWNMFCKIVFRGDSCPLELEKIGKKIVESCRGLPLSIGVMGGLLEKVERTKKCWQSIRISINSLVNLEKDKHCLKILKLSYNYLPVYLKPCFLYFGMYEEDSEIRVSRLIQLWVSEGFLKPVRGKSLETVAKMYLEELVDRNLILVHRLGRAGNMKYLKIHDLLRDLCLREAEKERFYHVVGKHSPQSTRSQRRRLVVPRSTSKKEVLHAMRSTPHVRSYISEHERVQLFPNLRLLRTLKACDNGRSGVHKYSLRKMFELINLRLLVVRSRWYPQLPSSISLLWSLQTLIVPHLKGDINAPVEIWNMPQLRHVHLHDPWRGAFYLLDPPSDNTVIMENLQTLKGVKNFKCDEMMVRRIPNIKKLGLVYEEDKRIGLDDGYCVHNIERLQKLESLSCEGFHLESHRDNFSLALTFPHSLKSLSLKIFKCRMEDILEKVSALPLLQKLILVAGDFSTGKWETVEGQFLSLKYLSLDSCRQLKCWMMESSSHFPCLERLDLFYLKHLKEIPAELGEIPTLKFVVLYECSESAVRSAKRMVKEQEELQELSFKVVVKLRKENEELQSLANPNFQVFAPKRKTFIVDPCFKMGCC